MLFGGTSEESFQAHEIRGDNFPFFFFLINYLIGSLTNLLLSVTEHESKNPTFCCRLAEQLDRAAKETSF